MTGTAWIEESGFLEGPVVITNTHSVGIARDAVIAWRFQHGAADNTGYWWSLPVVAETWDGWLNDINGFHVKPEHIAHALDSAHGGSIEEGSVGGGTGMICYEFKGGNGTASRKVDMKAGKDSPPKTFTVGVFVQANCGRALSSPSPVCRSAKKFLAKFTRKKRVQSSSLSQRMPRCSRINSNVSRAARRSVSRAPAAFPETVRAICSSRFQPRIRKSRIPIRSRTTCKPSRTT